ncbi:type I methionyl aminopeptidase [Candidatus Dojkabacteria bacterium]|uniref:Methionine aminopeptidase n=1 Tax=Candidatus Dojkabacteria bacterium TaxID=2099670 RepID=A0A955L8Y2_9BACT|nr:type I methionyl aminopeptidase [Candidatus Dojkabacteria bacterium]
MIIKTKSDLNNIKTAAKINTECLLYLKSITTEGIDSYEIDRKAEEFYKKNSAKPAFKGVPGSKFPYPATINFQRNDEVVHGIPHKDQIVEDGDIISIDTGCIYNGYYADHATSFGIGSLSEEDEKLLSIAKLSVEAGCQQAIAGNHVGDIGYAQQTIIEMAGFSVVKVLCGHEIGKSLWEDILIPAFGSRGSGETLEENLVVCIENQTCAGNESVYTESDGWLIKTKDGKKAATFEHMVLVKKGKPEILTQV